MPDISVRKLKEETIQLLRIQAVNHGVSMEEEVRQIIVRSVSTPELTLPERTIHEPVEFK